MNPDSPINGVYVAAVTPQRKGGEADVAAILELVDFLAKAGVNGIALLGSTGEFLHLAFEEWEIVIAVEMYFEGLIIGLIALQDG